MQCALSGEAPQEPVVSKVSGNVYEKRLIEKYIEQHGKEPTSGADLSLDDLLPLNSPRIVRPRPAAATSIPALLSTFQNEWDSLALETYALAEQLKRTREELSTALYQNDAAVRVIARLQKERDEARDALSRVSAAPAVPSNAGASADTVTADAMAVDNETLPEELQRLVEATKDKLSKSRKKRPVPDGWATAEQISEFVAESSANVELKEPTTISVQGLTAIIGALDDDRLTVYSIEADKVEQHISLGESATDSILTGDMIIVSSANGTVKVFKGTKEVASFKEHDGPVMGISLHPSNDILASVGEDRCIVFYDLQSYKRCAMSYVEESFSACAFHPDGHLFAAGTVMGKIKLYMTNTFQEAASFSLGTEAPVKDIAFSENGFWFAATTANSSTVTIFDLRKDGDAATAKVLEIGTEVQSIAWDYSQQFLATAGSGGVTVHQYSKGTKQWSEILRKDFSSAAIAWGTGAQMLVAAGIEANAGKVAVFSTKN